MSEFLTLALWRACSNCEKKESPPSSRRRGQTFEGEEEGKNIKYKNDKDNKIKRLLLKVLFQNS